MKVHNHAGSDRALGDRFISKDRLDLNDLIKRRQLEKKIDRKTNLLIFSGATAVATIVFIILIL
tara:strand:+ start:33 stop:224 length:192 start_codon:yes stop_codon:yes gene_type:complete